jgi:integrase
MEANGLKWQNVNLVTGILSVRQGRVLGKDKDPKTERAVRDVEITPGMRQAINDQKARSNPDSDYMFVTEQGRPLDISNFRAKIWSRALKKTRLKYRYPYQARHTFATKHLSQGIRPSVDSQSDGHLARNAFQTLRRLHTEKELGNGCPNAAVIHRKTH